MNGLSILGTGRCLPDHIVTNDDLARRVETSNDWIVSRTGIRERRFAQGETLTQLAVAAARRAMERAGVGPQDIGLCLMATVTPDWITPSQACLLHQELGLPEDCPAFDLSAGCTGFLYAMETAAAMLPRMARSLLDKAGMDRDQIDWYVLHQANHRILEGVAKRMKVPMERFYENIGRYGNTSAATIPIALDEMAEQELLRPGQWIMCLGFGAGLTWGGAMFRW